LKLSTNDIDVSSEPAQGGGLNHLSTKFGTNGNLVVVPFSIHRADCAQSKFTIQGAKKEADFLQFSVCLA